MKHQKEIEQKRAAEWFAELTRNFKRMEHVVESIRHLEAKDRLDGVSEVYL